MPRRRFNRRSRTRRFTPSRPRRKVAEQRTAQRRPAPPRQDAILTVPSTVSIARTERRKSLSPVGARRVLPVRSTRSAALGRILRPLRRAQVPGIGAAIVAAPRPSKQRVGDHKVSRADAPLREPQHRRISVCRTRARRVGVLSALGKLGRHGAPVRPHRDMTSCGKA